MDVSPIGELYKSEVRELGRQMGIQSALTEAVPAMVRAEPIGRCARLFPFVGLPPVKVGVIVTGVLVEVIAVPTVPYTCGPVTAPGNPF